MNALHLTLRQLQVFVAVAEAGSTVAAAHTLALSQSATSAALNELERQLGLRLFDRAGRRLLLNDCGRALMGRARPVLDAARAIEHIGKDAVAQREQLRIGASTTIGHYVLPRLLATFLGSWAHEAATWHSGVTIGNTAEVCHGVAAFELDIGLIEGPCHHGTLTASPWVDDEMIIVAAATGPSHAADADLPTLKNAVWLVREGGSGTRETTDRALLPYLGTYRRTIELGSSEAIKHAAVAGLGMACLSRHVVADLLASGELRELNTEVPTFRRRCHWVLHKDKQVTPALRELITLVEAMVEPGPLPCSAGTGLALP